MAFVRKLEQTEIFKIPTVFKMTLVTFCLIIRKRRKNRYWLRAQADLRPRKALTALQLSLCVSGGVTGPSEGFGEVGALGGAGFRGPIHVPSPHLRGGLFCDFFSP